MDKQLKTGLSIAIVGIGGYLLWKNWQKLYPTSTTSTASTSSTSTASSFTGPRPVGNRVKNAVGAPPSPGRDPFGVGRKKVGTRRMNCCGNDSGDFANSNSQVFASATGTKRNITDIISTHSSGWVRGKKNADGVTDTDFFQPKDSGWVKS